MLAGKPVILSVVFRRLYLFIVIILVVVVQLVCIQIATSATGSAGSNLTPEHHVLVVVDIVHGQPVTGHLQPAK